MSPVRVLSLDVQHNTRDDVANITFNDDDGMMITGTEIYITDFYLKRETATNSLFWVIMGGFYPLLWSNFFVLATK